MDLSPFVLAAVGFLAPGDAQETETVTALVNYRSPGGAYLDGGRDLGLREGDEGIVEHGGVAVGRLRVQRVTATSAYAEVVEGLPEDVQVGDRVRFQVTRPEALPGEAPPAERPRPENGVFEPLLTPRRPAGTSSHSDYFHGNVRLGTSIVHDRERDLDYWYHRLSSVGAGERLFGGPWSVEWAGEAQYRGGDGYSGDPDRGDVLLRADALVLRRHFEDGKVLGLGRFIPGVLPDYGRVDGGYAEVPLDGGFRIGALAGLRPDRDDLGFSTDELVLGGYGAYDHRFENDTRLFTAAGLLASWYEGAPDQHAAFLAGRLQRRSAWVNLSSQLDLYTGSEDVRSGVGVTRLSLNGGTALGSVVSVQAGWHQYQLPDTDSERSVYASDEFFDRGHRRVFLGVRERLPAGWSLGQEAAMISGADTEGDYQWTLRVQKTDLPWNGSVDVAAYRLTGLDADGYGGSLGVYVVPADPVQLQLLYDVSLVEFDVDPDEFFNSTLSLFVDWFINSRLTGSTRIGTSFGDDVGTYSLDLSLTWRF